MTKGGSGGKHYGACWRPVAPGGYVALGGVMSENTHDKPALTDVVCVREDLTHMADLKWIYEDKGTGAKDYFSVWANQVPPAYQDGRDGGHRAQVAPNTFTAASSWDEPSPGAPERRVLCIEMPVEEKPPGRLSEADRQGAAGRPDAGDDGQRGVGAVHGREGRRQVGVLEARQLPVLPDRTAGLVVHAPVLQQHDQRLAVHLGNGDGRRREGQERHLQR
ncbi:hypothetical protein AVW11_19820 [Streptomyces amritsarensis]|uniref:Uncharacterized protein n=1 Tax=Streptomyces amritsarensis TaxID=681158 RepID=A0ABX3FZU7_9ACTN|nr:hypothetical protein AVW11_19820 [Streptomyces amritsarensis]